MTESSQQLPPAAVFVIHPVADFDAWKPGFDAHEDARRAAGVLGHHLNRAQDDPNLIGIFLPSSDLEKTQTFAASDDLKEIMRDVGVTGPPEMTWLTPVREAAVWDRQLPAMTVRHRVADFDRWLGGYDGADELRVSNGIIGHAANRSIDDPSVALVYHQAESFETLQAFLDDPNLQQAMKDAGVSSEPEISFWNGGWGKLYD